MSSDDRNPIDECDIKNWPSPRLDAVTVPETTWLPTAVTASQRRVVLDDANERLRIGVQLGLAWSLLTKALDVACAQAME